MTEAKPREGRQTRSVAMPSSYTSLHYHLIFSTKNRVRQITADIRERLYQYMGGIIADKKGRLIAAGGIEDNVHLLASTHPTVAPADLARDVKANSSRWVHETFPGKQDFAWQDGYGAFAVSYSNIDDVKRYIANQEQHHRGK